MSRIELTADDLRYVMLWSNCEARRIDAAELLLQETEQLTISDLNFIKGWFPVLREETEAILEQRRQG